LRDPASRCTVALCRGANARIAEDWRVQHALGLCVELVPEIAGLLAGAQVGRSTTMDAPPEQALAELIRYNNWANQQVLAACQPLSASQLAATAPGVYGSIRDTLEHLIESEAGYVELLTGTRSPPPFGSGEQPDVAALRAYAAQVGEALVDAVNRVGLTDRVDEESGGQPIHYRALAVYIQIINHGIEHRTNITTILNTGLATPPGVDGWGYLAAHPERFDSTWIVSR
jgi:uncharacterized damage-inducible protein DinB